MKNTKAHNPNVGVKVVAGLIAASQVVSAAETEEEKVESLEPTTVVATKFEKKLSEVSQSVTVLDVEKLQNEGALSLQEAIGFRVPGVISTSTSGQRGNIGTLLIRGTSTNKSHLRVDGVRLSNSNSLYQLFLGNANINGLKSVEILRGPASGKYGGESIGGVLALTTAKGNGDLKSKFTTELGSFDSWSTALSTQGEIDKLSYNFGIAAEATDNDPANSDEDESFDQNSSFLRLDYQLNDYSSVGATVRIGDSTYNTPRNGPQESDYDYQLATFFYENAINENFDTKLTLGYSQQAWDNATATSSQRSDSEIFSINWDNRYSLNDKHTITAGAFFENVQFSEGSAFPTFSFFSDSSSNRDSYGAYVDHEWKIVDTFSLNGGVRWEEYSDHDDETSWSLGALFEVANGLVVKGNIGETYRVPDLGEIAGGFETEETFGWDVGVEKELGNTKLSATWFETDIENYIYYDPTIGMFGATVQADEDTKRSGLEFAMQSSYESVNLWLNYTYLQRSALGNALPQQTVAGGVSVEVSDALNLGAKATWVDQATWNANFGNNNADYFLTTLFANWQVADNVKLHGRVENLFDDKHTLGDFGSGPIEGRGRGFYGGVTVTF